jgi:hypothetical protein
MAAAVAEKISAILRLGKKATDEIFKPLLEIFHFLLKMRKK